MSSQFRRSALIGAGVATVLTAGTILVACGSGGAGVQKSVLTVADSYIPLPATPGGMAAGYLTVKNTGGAADQLVKVSSPAATSVTMHRSTDSTMQEVDSLDVPAHGTLALDRGGNHLMIMGWEKAPALGDRLELDLTFAKGETISVQVPVKPLTYRPGS
ncbi:copper chaperone PCu(A)C [Kitasatospora sp. NPDC056138]|uniref:copper chaperone PCu(A)C n=1 Tax=Kitasatospora sp. NPDC056138 TaxID=3345724 RepID=UPI0035DBE383